jgi:nucleotide-binding universal stress UspA family protein
MLASGVAGDRVVTRLYADPPIAALLAAAEQADMIVVGARGLGEWAGMLLGSVSRACARHATCPVAVIK